VSRPQKQTNEASRASDPSRQEATRLLDSVLENMNHGVVVYDKDNRLLVHNPRFAEMYGLKLEELEPGTHRDLVAESVIRHNWPDRPAKVYEFLEAGPTRDSKAAPERAQIELKDGRIHERSAVRLPDGGLVATHIDITSHKRSEREALNKTVLLELTLDAMDQGILAHDSRTIALANRRFAELLGIPERLVEEGQPVEPLQPYRD
jgi:PAS domain S-box-containing protein